jgi:hypothetical protein
MGRLTFPGFRSQSPFPDLVAIYRGTNFKREEGETEEGEREEEEQEQEEEEEVANTAIDLYNHKRSKIAILSSFTGDTDLIRQCVDEDEDGDGDGDGDAYKGYGDEDEDENGDDDDGDQQYDEQEVRRRTKSAMVKRR